MLNFNNYLNVTDTINYKYVKENLITLARNMVADYFADKPMFNAKNFKYYYYDDFIFDTNNSQNNYITLYVEINQPRNVKEIQDKKFAKKDKNIKDLHLTLAEIKNGLFEQCVLSFDNTTLIWQEQYSINLSVNEVDYENVCEFPASEHRRILEMAVLRAKAAWDPASKQSVN